MLRKVLLALALAAPAFAAEAQQTSTSVGAGPFAVTPPVTAGAYAANNAIGGLQTVSVFRTTAPPSGILAQIGLASKSGLTTTQVLYAFTKLPTSTCPDKAAFALASADLPFLVPGFPVSLTPAAAAGTTQTTASVTVNEPVRNAEGKTNLYFCAVTTGTPTPASTTDLVFTYTMLQD